MCKCGRGAAFIQMRYGIVVCTHCAGDIAPGLTVINHGWCFPAPRTPQVQRDRYGHWRVIT